MDTEDISDIENNIYPYDEYDEYDDYDEYEIDEPSTEPNNSSVNINENNLELGLSYSLFDSRTEYLFVNKCLTLVNGPLPSYAYYQSNDEILDFWDDLEYKYYPIIYWYLVDNEYINDYDIHSLKEIVIDFVNSYFENRQ